ncbi:hypothetical protein ScPMuIL_014427 [Solemya velum]
MGDDSSPSISQFGKENEFLAGFDMANSTVDDLTAAFERATETNSLMPLVKVELNSKIKLQRHADGRRTSIFISKNHGKAPQTRLLPSSLQQLSLDSLARLGKRRKQNVMASKKYREKRKTKETDLEKVLRELEAVNMKLKMEIENCCQREKQSAT